ncbi:tRNA dihydrouridine synthase [Prevotella scopos]|uniref:tRNA dihydrouridine synthase n=1 Tax=Prevotella scopos TaxID=589437 RepID=UPI00131EF877|nr:tRNA-dihydrouridine synthase family protein [Prevotella scopos]
MYCKIFKNEKHSFSFPSFYFFTLLSIYYSKPFRYLCTYENRNNRFGGTPTILGSNGRCNGYWLPKDVQTLWCSMVYTEFVSADAVIRSIKSTLSKLVIDDSERPVGIQIYGRDVASMVEAAKIVEQVKPDVIDINFGCPVKKVANKGAGSGMLKNIPLLLDITREVVKAVNTPVTVKTRLGWDNDNLVITDLAEQLQDCGIKALTIHGRTRAQMYTGEADWTLIGEVKNNPRIHIPIIGNGDVTSIEEANEKFDRYGVDAVMIGRATFGCPWLFNQGEKQLTIDDKIDILEEMLRINVERIDEHRGILHTRRHLAASPIFKGIPDFKKTRIAMLRTTKMDELMAILEDCRERLRE